MGYRNLEELQPAINLYCIRNGYGEVQEKLPEVVVENRLVSLSPAQRKKYDELAIGMLQTGDVYKHMNPLERLIRLFECCDTLKMLGDVEDRSAKIDEAFDLLTGELKGTPTLLFSQFKPPLHSLCSRLRSAGVSVDLIDGDVPVEVRGRIQKEFNAGHLDVLLISTAGEEALNLQGGKCIILLDRLYSPMRNKQIIGRIARIGQDSKQVALINIIAKDTVDETHVFKILKQKVGLINDIFIEQDLNSLGLEHLKCLISGDGDHLM